MGRALAFPRGHLPNPHLQPRASHAQRCRTLQLSQLGWAPGGRCGTGSTFCSFLSCRSCDNAQCSRGQDPCSPQSHLAGGWDESWRGTAQRCSRPALLRSKRGGELSLTRRGNVLGCWQD